MTEEQLRRKLLERLDAALARPLLSGLMSQEDRDVVMALRQTVIEDDGAWLIKVLSNMPKREGG